MPIGRFFSFQSSNRIDRAGLGGGLGYGHVAFTTGSRSRTRTPGQYVSDGVGERRTLTFIVRRMHQIARLAETYTKRIVPVDTGALRDSIFVEFLTNGDQGSLFMRPAVPYAIYVEARFEFMRATFNEAVLLLNGSFTVPFNYVAVNAGSRIPGSPVSIRRNQTFNYRQFIRLEYEPDLTLVRAEYNNRGFSGSL